MRFGIIGTGNITEWFLDGVRVDSRFEAAALYSRTHERGDMFARRHGIGMVFTSLDEMLESGGIDAVYIASPNNLHASQAIACMRRGKHVLCEKPIASNSSELREMIAVAHEQGVLLMEAMTATLNPNFAVVRAFLPKLGKIRRYVSSYCQYSSRYDRFKAGELPNVFNPAYSAGALMDLGIYTVYPMVALFGKPEEVDAHGVMLPSGVDAQGTIHCSYPGGMEVTLIYSKIANSYLPTEIEGENGNLLLNDIHNLREVTFIPRPEATSGRNSDFSTIPLGAPDIPDLYFCEVKEFIDTIESHSGTGIQSAFPESQINSHRNSMLTLEVLDEARRQMGIVFPSDPVGFL